jgi:hypothetical protein
MPIPPPSEMPWGNGKVGISGYAIGDESSIGPLD